MRIGIFDSGLGGLLVAKAIRKLMPEYDYVYLGDTKRVPYGNRSHEVVYEFTKEAVDYLFKKENCAIVILACNTASARALRTIQQEYLPACNSYAVSIAGRPKHYPDKKVLGVLIPTAEECTGFEKIGVIGTKGTVASNSFVDEILKIKESNFAYAEKSTNYFPLTKIFQNSAPMLVPLAEEDEKSLAMPFLKKYLKPLLDKKIEALVLGCTHYPIFKKEIKKILTCQNGGVGKKVKVLSQDEIIPKKLKEYFKKHSEIEKNLSKNKTAKILVTDITDSVKKLSIKWFGSDAKPELIHF